MKSSRNCIDDIEGSQTPYFDQWPVRADEYITEEPDTWVQSACVLCSNGCGIDIGVKDKDKESMWILTRIKNAATQILVVG